MTIISGIASAVAGTALKALFDGGSKQQPGGVQIINRVKPETPAEMVARLRKSVEALGGKKGQKYWDEKRRRQSMIGKKKPLESAKSKAAQYLQLMAEAERAASGTPAGVVRSRSIGKPRKPTAKQVV
jgi:hypothetical protein